MQTSEPHFRVAIACGGTGGHLFPGLAVAEALQERDCDVLALVSPKDVDQNAIKRLVGVETATLPAVGLERGSVLGFLKGFWRSYYATRKLFADRPPAAVLAMGGFTSAPPLLAARSCGAATFLHEANSIPGRANRFFAPWVHEAFAFFPGAVQKLRASSVHVVGMPVRSQFQKQEASACRMMLGFKPEDPVLLVMGGSQGASAINELIIRALPELVQQVPKLQFLHLTGFHDENKVRAAYATRSCRAVVRPFLTEMELAMSAATLAVSRAGASSLAEIAALQLPAILIPYPAAVSNHQFYNAMALVETGAARMMTQKVATPELLAQLIQEMLTRPAALSSLATALAEWHHPNAAEVIANRMLAAVALTLEDPAVMPAGTPIRPLTKSKLKPSEL